MAFVATRPAPSDGSRTITVHDNQPGEGVTHDGTSGESLAVGTLRLRAAPRSRQRVVWRDDVVDNEGAGKKSSKICCIYHKPKKFDESSSEESSDSDSDSSCSHDHRRPHRGRARRPASSANGNGQAMRSNQAGGVIHELEGSSDEANVYERAPGRKSKKGKMVARS
ncbi:hypothetical protein AcV7_006208 [Taiwanofungus camphoratus]|nr:hypothetical protein AcV7_006208 [Antrodia cinnamomea]